MRIACLRIPDLPLVAELRAHPEYAGRPLAVASGAGPRAEIVAVSPEAARAGVRRASSVTHARAVCGQLTVRVASPALEHAARAALLDAALGCSPRAALAPPSSGAYAGEAVAFLDATGITALFHSEEGFAAALWARARALGLQGSVSVASSHGVALIAARQLSAEPLDEDSLVLAPGAEAAFLAPLPIDILDPNDALSETFVRFGVRCVRDLLALPKRGLATRLGPQVLELIALARGEGRELPFSAQTSGRLTEAIDLEFPVERLEPLTFVLQGLLSRLLARLEARSLACGELRIALELDGGGRDARRVGVAAPTLDLRVLLRLLCHALEARAPEAPVLSAALATEGVAVQTDQLDLFRPPGPAPAELGRTLAELEALCGDGRIGAPGVADDNHPEAFSMRPFAPQKLRSLPRDQGSGQSPLQGGMGSARLAIRALRPPVSASVRLRAGSPEHVRSAIANGSVMRCAGPWRTTGGWWSREGRYAYDSFDVQTSDGIVSRLRFDHVQRRWHIDAVYD